MLERTTPSPVLKGTVLTAVRTPADDAAWGYLAVFTSDERIPPARGLICEDMDGGPPRTVVFSHREKKWKFGRKIGAKFLYDDEYQGPTLRISETEAAEIARNIGTYLPSKEDLRTMILRGEAQLRSERRGEG